MRIKATPIKARDLLPGSLFSVRGPDYWDNFASFLSIGESVYIRTEQPAELAEDYNATVFKIEIEK